MGTLVFKASTEAEHVALIAMHHANTIAIAVAAECSDNDDGKAELILNAIALYLRAFIAD
jgi:hypothetical protein